MYLVNNSLVRQKDNLARFFPPPQAYKFQNFFAPPIWHVFYFSFFFFFSLLKSRDNKINPEKHKNTNQGESCDFLSPP